MSKLSKLISNPRLFALDSKIYRRLAVLRRRADSLLRPRETPPWPSADDPTALRDYLLELLHARLPIVDLSGVAGIEVGVLRSDIHKLTEVLCELADTGRVALELTVRRKHLTLPGARLFAIDDFIAAARVLTVEARRIGTPETVSMKFALWEKRDDHFIGPTPHPVLQRVPTRIADDLGMFRPGRVVRGRDLHDHQIILEPEFPIDIVYTWVNHDDPEWRSLRAAAGGAPVETEADDARSLDRFKSRDELKYSLRSVMRFAPWARTIFVVTNCAPPPWLDVEHPKIQWIDHAQILPAECLPTFNSHAIEARLHHIPELADHFVYFNDDFFLTRPTEPGDFFFCNGLSKSFMDPSGVVVGAPHPAEPDYLNAARNGKRLLERTLGRSAPSIHMHAPYALRRDVLEEMEQQFADAMNATARSTFRSPSDISALSYLYHHYAYLTCRAVYAKSDAKVLTYFTPGYEKTLLGLLNSAAKPLSICLNDGFGSAAAPRWERHVTDFLETFYPRPSELERTG